jgi:hypothetical protein
MSESATQDPQKKDDLTDDPEKKDDLYDRLGNVHDYLKNPADLKDAARGKVGDLQDYLKDTDALKDTARDTVERVKDSKIGQMVRKNSKIVLGLLVVNVCIFYVIKTIAVNPVKLDEWFPTNCNKAPYGPSKLCGKLSSVPARTTTGTSISTSGGGRSGPSLPYSFYSSSDDFINGWTNWVLKAITLTDISIFTFIKSTLLSISENNDKTIYTILILLFGFVYLLFLLVVVGIWGNLGLSLNELGGLFSKSKMDVFVWLFCIITLIPLCFTLNPFWGFFWALTVFYKFILEPLLFNFRGVLTSVGWTLGSVLLATAFMLILLISPGFFGFSLDGSMEIGIKISLSILYISMLLIMWIRPLAGRAKSSA